MAVQPNPGPAWTEEYPSGRGQGQSVHLDTGMSRAEARHRNSFGRDGVPGPQLSAPFQSDFKLKSCSEAQLLPQVADFLKNRLPQAPSQGRLLPVTPSHQGRMIGNLCQRGAWLQMTALSFSRPCAAWGSGSTVSKPFPVPPPLPSSWQSLEF